MSRYAKLFAHLAEQHEGGYVPFITLGDPSIPLSEEIIEALINGGADALELGMPFSDPVADGPVIQAANIRALSAGAKIEQCFALLKRVRTRHPDVPMGLLVYCNLVHAKGIDAFYAACKDAGVDSVLIADVPMRESLSYRSAAKQHGIASVFICPPDATTELRRQVAEFSEGYVYLLSRSGVTGTGVELSLPTHEAIDELKTFSSAPALLGFGISQPSHVRQAIESGAAGAISGSAVVGIIAKYQQQPNIMLSKLIDFTQAMKAATRKY